MRRLKRLAWNCLPVLLAVLVASGTWRPALVDQLDAMVYDARLRWTMPQMRDDRIVIIDIDEASLAEHGRWPWSRRVLADLVHTLFSQHDIAVLGMDVVFAESDDSSGLAQLERLAKQELRSETSFRAALERLRPQLDHDQQLADALRNRPVVLGYYLSSDRDGLKAGVLPAPVIDPATTGDRPFRATQWNGYGSNIAPLAQAAPIAGFFNPIVDVDGVVRSLPLLAEHDGRYYESLALAMFRVMLGLPSVRPGYPEASSQSALLASVDLEQDGRRMTIPVDDRVATLVPFRGRGGPKGGTYTYISAADVLNQRLPPGLLDGTAVLLGTTAPGLLDLRATPVSEVYPGVETHANLLAGLIDGHLPVKPDYALGFELALVVVTGLALAFGLPWLGAVWSWVVSAGVAGALVAGNVWLYSRHGLALPLATAWLMVLAVFVVNTLYGYLVESRGKRELANLFGSYVPPELVEEMVKEPERYSMQAADRELTVMFSDMRGFTQLSEKMTPAQLQQFLNRLFTRLSLVIRQQRGTIDKFMGDCVMAFWGAPVVEARHARLAVQAALDMRQAVRDINADNRLRHLPEIGMGVGLNTGMMCVGDMGSTLRRSYTVIGDAVNLGSRLEGLGKHYGVDIVASASTREQAGDGFVWQELDRVKVKGKDQAVAIFTVVGAAGEVPPDTLAELDRWHQCLALYRSRQWAASRQALAELLAAHPNTPLYLLYLERLATLETAPPDDDWDGSVKFDSK